MSGFFISVKGAKYVSKIKLYFLSKTPFLKELLSHNTKIVQI